MGTFALKNCQAIALAAILLFAVALSGCLPDKDTLPMPPGSSPVPTPMPDQITVDVYWDATVSMKGFTTLAAGNVYRTLPDTLGDLSSSLGEVRFFRFGEQVVPVEGREHRRFSNPEYYTELVTSFGTVLDEADPEHLSIVITDLFESDADWSNVTQKLREKYFSKHLAVAIIGIKNSFNGDIFDVGLNAAKFSYDSGDDPARFRPFYLFLMGSEPQLQAFLEQWERQQVPASEMKCVVFSEHFASYAADMKNSVKDNLLEDRKLSKADDRLKEMVVSDKSKDVKFKLPGKFQPYPNACSLVIDKLEKRVKIFAWEKSEDTDGTWKQHDAKGVNLSFALRNADENGNNCDMELTFSPNSTLPLGRIGLVQVQIVPSRQSVDLPIWISEWDMGNIDIAPEKFDGSKTVNLQHIAASLKDSLLAVAQPTIAELYLVIDGR